MPALVALVNVHHPRGVTPIVNGRAGAASGRATAASALIPPPPTGNGSAPLPNPAPARH